MLNRSFENGFAQVDSGNWSTQPKDHRLYLNVIFVFPKWYENDFAMIVI
jgi:hypothetical protein